MGCRPKDRDQAEFGWGLRPAFQSPMAGQPEIVFPSKQFLPLHPSLTLLTEM